MKKKGLLLLALCVVIFSYGDIRLPKIVSDNMVLQRNKPITIWGWADANEKVTVHFNKQIKSGKADKSGKWSITLDAEAAGGPFQLTNYYIA